MYRLIQENLDSRLNGSNSDKTILSSAKLDILSGMASKLDNISELEGVKKQAEKLEKFYAKKSVFITGATGFIGKVFLVKLMHSLKSCGQVYVMVRGKKGLTAQQRFNNLLAEEPFAPAPGEENPTGAPPGRLADELKYITREQLAAIDWSKVVPVEGDMRYEDLGMADKIKTELCKNVNIVFNIAASVRFDAPLKENLRDNYYGPKNLIGLVMKFENLISFVHVSTFFVNCHISHVEEKVLQMERDCEKTAEMISFIPDSIVNTVSPHILEQRPNTYVLTKAMAENLLQKYQGRLPIAIVRPSITMPSSREPFPGWIDNRHGPMGLSLLVGLGVLRYFEFNYYSAVDFIPVDYVANTMLAVAERTARLYPKDIKVYNCSTSSLNPVSWGQMGEICYKEVPRAPFYKMLRLPVELPRKRSRASAILGKISEILFAYLIDLLLLICGQKPMLIKVTKKLHQGQELFRFFTTNSFTCANDNFLACYHELDDEDKKNFCFDPVQVDWNQYFIGFFYGVRRLLLKEDISNVPNAIKKMKIQMRIEFSVRVIFWASIAWCFYRFVNFIV